MYISGLHLTQFRNYAEARLRFCPGINCLVGPNGSGKTNLLDAIHFLAFTRGFRSSQDKMAMQDGEEFFFNGGTLYKQGIKQEVYVNFAKGKGKKVLVNQKPVDKMSDHIGKIPLVAVLPNDTDLINGAAAERRRFLDMLISQYDPAYLRHLIAYERVLSQRNAQLRMFADTGRFDRDQLEIWNSQLIPHGIAIFEGRRQFLEAYMPFFEAFFRNIVSQKETPSIRYRSQINQNTTAEWADLLAQTEEKDRVMLHSGSGIHRDDLHFRIDDYSARNYGSQGQQKTFIIALKLAQYRLLERQTGVPPILLLDDIFDKLDEHRLGSIAQLLDQEIEGQIFITDTSYERLASVFSSSLRREKAFFEVEKGRVKSLKADNPE
ncbi:MAG: DNA replication/repair protein RecF [Bacteroidia bacterium]|nr:DNA replication/repair protein RecF [Bacteroidia bacterium]